MARAHLARWEMNIFHPQLLGPGVMLDVVTQEMTMESRPLSPKKESHGWFSFHQKIRKILVTSYHSSKQKEADHSNHSTKNFHIEVENLGNMQLCVVFCSSNNRNRARETHCKIFILSKLSFSQLWTEIQQYFQFINIKINIKLILFISLKIYASIHI